jgi:DNA-binding MarR family transcriptional regulator
MEPYVTEARIAMRLGRAMSRALDEEPLTPAGYRMLAYLSSEATAATVLARKLSISGPSVAATTDWLVERGYVTRVPDPSDRRRVRIEISDAGTEALRCADARLASRLSELAGDSGTPDAERVLGALRQLGTALDRDRDERNASLLERQAK